VPPPFLGKPHEPEQQDTDQQEDNSRIDADDSDAADPDGQIGMVYGKQATSPG
jgi:hypothetical protein